MSFVTFHNNTGFGYMKQQEFVSGEDFILSFNSFDKVGYKFEEWNTELGGTGDSYQDGGEVILTVDTDLYAQWAPKNITVTYDAQGGGMATETATIEFGDEYGAPLSVAARNGYTLIGWYTEPNGNGGEVTDVTEMLNPENHRLYALWEPVIITINFSDEGGTEPDPLEIPYGSNYGNIEKPIRSDYAFKGWFTQATGGKRVLPDTIIDNDSDHTLYAQWESTEGSGIEFSNFVIHRNSDTEGEWLGETHFAENFDSEYKNGTVSCDTIKVHDDNDFRADDCIFNADVEIV